jgi:hypothetical protein
VNVQRVELARHPMLQEMAALLARVQLPLLPPARPYDEHGDWRADIAAGVPSTDRPKPLHYRRQFVPTAARLLSMPDDVAVSTLNYYPPGGAGIGWHTDSRAAGWRIYIARPLSPILGEFITPTASFCDMEGYGLAFAAGPGAWHAVRAEGPRLSIGLRVYGAGRTARLLGLL